MRHWLNKNRPTITFLVLIAVGLLLHFWMEEWWLSSAAHALSDALMVAGLLGLTVDRFLKHDLMRDVGAIIIGWALPDEIRNHIREATKTSIVRRNHRLDYSFSASSDSDDVVIDATEEWEIFNYSSETERYEPHFAINTVDNLDRSSICCTISPRDCPTRVFTSEELNDEKCLTEEKTRLVYRPKINLTLPYQILEDYRTKAACVVKWHYRFTKKRDDFIATHSTRPTIGTTVSIKCDCGLNFEFDPVAEHAEGSTEWRYTNLFMPLQTWFVRWRPENDAVHQ